MLRPTLTLLAALLLATGGRAASAQAARAPEPLVAVARAVPAPTLLRQARLLGRQAQGAPVSLALTLPLRNQDGLRALIHRITDRNDPAYGHYLSGAQFDAQFAPTDADYQAVVDFARARGLTVRAHAGRTVVGVSGTSGAVESAFGVRLNRYRLPEGRVAYANDAAPRVPASVAARLGGIVGLDTLTRPQPHLRRPDAGHLLANAGGAPIGSDPSGGLTPTDIRAVYNLSGVGLRGEGQTLALQELDGYDPSDVSQYNAQFGLGADLGSVLDNVYVGGFDGSAGDAQSEVVLDIDMMLALAPRAQRIYVYEASNNNANALEELAEIADDDLAQSVSTSFGQAETVLQIFSSYSGFQTLLETENAAFEKMAVQGQSFFAAAGDNGALDDGFQLSVDDPASQPFVTAVGGTSLRVAGAGTPQIAYQSETTWNNGTAGAGAGGGGTSLFFPKPYYQYTSASTVNPSGPLGASATMRDVPDVSLDADPNTGYAIYVAADNAAFGTTGFEVIGGTSAAAPLWAAFAALVNEARATGATAAPTGTVGTPANPLGFANTLIYEIGTGKLGSYANDFHDIADNSNNLFYPAVAGYDDATGWGSFNGANLLADLAAAGNTAFTGPAGTLSGTVRFDGTAPPAGVTALVRATSSDGIQRGSATTDAAGRYTLSLPSGFTYTLNADAPGYVGQTVAGVAVSAGGTTQNFTLTNSQSAHTFPAGLQMVSTPFDFSAAGLDFAGLFGLTPPLPTSEQLIVWQPLAGAYAYYPAPPADTLRPGVGYWLRVPAGSGFYLHRQGAPVASPFQTTLQIGWNQIGDPFTDSVPFADVTVTRAGGAATGTLDAARTLVSPILYTYPAGATAYSPETSQLTAYLGYWVYAYAPVTLTFNDPAQTQSGG